jgi:hypothetical protein
VHPEQLASVEKGSQPPAAAPSSWLLPPARSVPFTVTHGGGAAPPPPTASAGGGARAPVAELAIAMERRDTVLASSYRPTRPTDPTDRSTRARPVPEWSRLWTGR